MGAKAVRRRRRRQGDERTRVLGAAREFESLLLDLGHPIDPASTTAERARASWRELGIDAAAIYGLASAARFDPSQPRVGSGDQAWRELGQAAADDRMAPADAREPSHPVAAQVTARRHMPSLP